MVVSDQLKAQITDFGIAQIVDVRGFTTVTERNIRYTAPELMPEASDKLDSEASVTTIPPTKRSDIFSLGILFLQVCGSTQFSSNGLDLMTILTCYSSSIGSEMKADSDRKECHIITLPSNLFLMSG